MSAGRSGGHDRPRQTDDGGHPSRSGAGLVNQNVTFVTLSRLR